MNIVCVCENESCFGTIKISLHCDIIFMAVKLVVHFFNTVVRKKKKKDKYIIKCSCQYISG